MDELDSALKLSVSGDLRKDVLKKSDSQIKEWGLMMPSGEPLVLDFGLGNFCTTGLIEYWITNEVKAGYCGKFLFVFDGQSCPMHSHCEKHETFFVLRGKIKVTTDSGTMILEQGDVLPVSVNLKHSFTGIGNAIVLEISKPCKLNDNEFVDSRIMKWTKRF